MGAYYSIIWREKDVSCFTCFYTRSVSCEPFFWNEPYVPCATLWEMKIMFNSILYCNIYQVSHKEVDVFDKVFINIQNVFLPFHIRREKEMADLFQKIIWLKAYFKSGKRNWKKKKTNNHQNEFCIDFNTDLARIIDFGQHFFLWFFYSKIFQTS